MNTRIKCLIFACIALLSAACVEKEVEYSTVDPEGVEMIISAVREGNVPDTRTVRDSTGAVEWCPMDEISVFYTENTKGGSRFTCQSTEQTAIAEFKGRLEGVIAGGEYFTNGKYLYGVYPYSANTKFKDGVTTITLPSNQTAVEGTFANGLFPTIARAQSVNLAFYNICGGVKFMVSREDITSVSIKGNNDERLAGVANVSFNENGKPVVLAEEVGEDGSKKEITVYAPKGGTFEPGKEYYIVAYPVKLGSGYTMTFRTTEMKEGSYVSNSEVEIQRSVFGVLDQKDKEVASWTEITSGGGGTNSGVYLGIMGFNDLLYPYPVSELTSGSKSGFDSFIGELNMKPGTLLYRSVDEALNTMQSVPLPVDLSKVAIVTFTDGLDQGSASGTDYTSGNEYLDSLNWRIKNETVGRQSITAYSIGILGEDVGNNLTEFRNNLKKLASSDGNATEVKSMPEVNAKFKEIAEQLSKSNYVQTIELKIPTPFDNTKVRFTFDNVNSAVMSTLYIEGTFRNNSLEEVRYKGLKSTSGTIVKGTAEGIFTIFTFEGVQTDKNILIEHKFTDEWYFTSGNQWQINSEFQKQQVSEIVYTRSSAVIMLVLDCSSSLDKGFSRVQASAKDFISTLSAVVDGGSGETPVGNTSIYSTTPIDLSLAMSKGGTRYYLTKAEYDRATFKDAVVEGLCVVSGTNTPFIIALNNAAYDKMCWNQANGLYDLPTYSQGSVISNRWTSINNALKAFGGSAIITAWTNEQYGSGSNYYYISGGSLSSTSSNQYVRQVVSLDSLATPWLVSPEKDLTLVVANGEDRKFIDKDEFEKYGVEPGYDIEVLAICSKSGNFILELNNASSSSMSHSEAVQSYGEDLLLTRKQGLVISARWTDINNALKAFGGSAITNAWTSEQNTNGSYYYIDQAGGALNSGSGNKYVRRVVGTF